MKGCGMSLLSVMANGFYRADAVVSGASGTGGLPALDRPISPMLELRLTIAAFYLVQTTSLRLQVSILHLSSLTSPLRLRLLFAILCLNSTEVARQEDCEWVR